MLAVTIGNSLRTPPNATGDDLRVMLEEKWTRILLASKMCKRMG